MTRPRPQCPSPQNFRNGSIYQLRPFDCIYLAIGYLNVNAFNTQILQGICQRFIIFEFGQFQVPEPCTQLIA